MIEILIVNSFFIVGLWRAIDLFGVREWFSFMHPILRKPLIDCVPCMASFWGVAYLTFHCCLVWKFKPLFWLPFYIPALSLLNCFVLNLFNWLADTNRRNKTKELLDE